MGTYELKRMATIGLLIFVTSITFVQAVGPWCFACKDVFHPAICQSVVQCGEHEFCHTAKTISNNGASLYTTSCKDLNVCKTHRKRRALSGGVLCDQCCNGTLCNAEGCGAPPIKTPQQLYCLSCDFVQSPSDCDRVDVCSVDKVCSITAAKQFTFSYNKLGCRAKTSCPAPTATLAKDNNICCDTDLCNSNDLGIDPSLYTTTPIPTTRKPAKPIVTFDNAAIEYKKTHAPNEEMELLCHVTGGPVPTASWTFDSGNGSVPVTSGISQASNGDSILSIPDPDKSNSGKYTCTATNALGSSQKDLTVIVVNPPKIEGSLNNSIDAQYQEDITLDCNVTMDNSTTVDWVIPPNVKSYTIHPNHSLTVYNVHNENNGDYSCIAENADGNTTKSFSVSVNSTSATTPQTSPASCTCPTVITTPCPTVTTTPCPTVTPTPCPTVTATSCPKINATPCPTQPAPTSTTTPQNMKTLQTTNLLPTTPPNLITSTNLPPTTPPNLITPISGPIVNPVSDQFQATRKLNIMLCPVGGNAKSNVTWTRLVQDFDHTDPVYIESQAGVLTISNEMSVVRTGVYECRVGNTPIAQFVMYGSLPNSVQCNSLFKDFSKTSGIVIKAHCPPCPYVTTTPPSKLTVGNFICYSGSVSAAGGDVTYLVKQGGEVVTLDQYGGNILIK